MLWMATVSWCAMLALLVTYISVHGSGAFALVLLAFFTSLSLNLVEAV